jgi:hypothetical protein
MASLSAEGLLSLTRSDATTPAGLEEFADGIKTVMDAGFKSAVMKVVEKEAQQRFPGDLSQYLELSFNPYLSTIRFSGKQIKSDFVEQAFAQTFMDYRLSASIEKSMRLVEAARIDLDRIKGRLSDEGLSSDQRTVLQGEYNAKLKEMKQLKANLTSGPDSPIWVWHGL